MDHLATVLRSPAGLDELEVCKVGTIEECLAFLAEKLLPQSNNRNLKELECNEGRMYSVEMKVFGDVVGGEWKEYKYLYLPFPEK